MPKTPRGGLTLAEHDGPGGRGHGRVFSRLLIVGAVLVVAIGAWLGISDLRTNFGPTSCTTTVSGQDTTFSPEQTANAALITAVATKRGLPARAATIAIATAITESKLRNLQFGDRDSLGLFQQRPSQGWGTQAQLLDPVYASNKFYDALVKIDGYQTKDITTVAQAVQRSAVPEAYAAHEQEGRALASMFTGNSPAAMGCRLDAATTSVTPQTVVDNLAAQMGVTAQPGTAGVTLTASSNLQAWSVGEWAVAFAEAYGIDKVTVGGRTWSRERGEQATSWSGTGTDGSAVTIHLAGR